MELRRWWLKRKIDADLVVKIIQKEARIQMASFDTRLMDIQQKFDAIIKRLDELARR